MMKLWKYCALALACAASLTLALPDDADARRMGGGRSFGSSSTMSRPATRPPVTTTQPGSTFNRQNPTAGAAGGAMASQGMFGGMGGMLGGLLAGSLIGSMFSGGGAGMAGAGGGGGLLDIILIGLLFYLGYRFFMRRRNTGRNGQNSGYGRGNHDAQGYGAYGNQGYGGQSYGSPSMRTGAGSAWDNLSSRPDQGYGDSLNMPRSSDIPADFDQEEFLRGAKMAYTRMQDSWDKRDLDDIAQFATPAVMEELRRQQAEDPQPSVTEILLLNASLMEVRQDVDAQRAAVYFDVLMREDPRASQPSQVREVWHFVRPLDGSQSWKLDGIQQMA